MPAASLLLLALLLAVDWLLARGFVLALPRMVAVYPLKWGKEKRLSGSAAVRLLLIAVPISLVCSRRVGPTPHGKRVSWAQAWPTGAARYS